MLENSSLNGQEFNKKLGGRRMSRLLISTEDNIQQTVERLYKDLERHIVASRAAAGILKGVPCPDLRQMRTLPYRTSSIAGAFGRCA